MGLAVAQSKFYVWKKKILELLKKMNFANILYIILFINVALACKSAPPKEEVATTTTTTGKSFQETWIMVVIICKIKVKPAYKSCDTL